MTLLEIKDAKTQLLDANDAIFNTAAAEQRSMTDAENLTVQKNIIKLRELGYKEESESFKDSKGIVVKNSEKRFAEPKVEFSLIKAINDKIENRNLDDSARNLFTQGKQEFRRAGVTYTGDIVIPVETRAAILAGTATAGQEIVAEEKKAILPPLVDKLVFSQAGATYLTGLVGNVSIPSYAGTAVAWKTEVEAAADGGGAFTEVEFSPNRLTAYLLVSKLFLAQDGVGAERLLLDNIANAIARKLEATILGPAAGSASVPSGIGYKLNVANAGGKAVVTPATYANMVALETSVDTANALAGNLAYITNGIGRGLLKSIDKGTLNDTGEMICGTDNKVNGYPLYVTNSIPSTYGQGGDGNMIAFGNWADLCIAQWGGYDITVDPYSAAATNQVKIVINAYFDAKGLRGSTGAGATLDEYAYSFSAMSIK
jgi:HK97 family phage major capsid protein